MNGFLPTSTPVRAQQWWRTRDQGDSLAVAQRLADIVGIDFYPRHALVSAGPLTVYLDGSRTSGSSGGGSGCWPGPPSRAAADDRRGAGRALGGGHHPAQPGGPGDVQLPPEDLIGNYSQCMRWIRPTPAPWTGTCSGAPKYWLLRDRQGDPSYLRAFARVLDSA